MALMRRLAGFLAVFAIIASLAPFAAMAAEPYTEVHNEICQARSAFCPDNITYGVRDHGDGSGLDTARFGFMLTESELRAMKRGGALNLEIGFRFSGYYIAEDVEIEFGEGDLTYRGWTEHRGGTDPVLWMSGIDIAEIVPGEWYDFQVTFGKFYSYGDGIHTLTLDWAVGEWYKESYSGECLDDGSESVKIGRRTFCTFRDQTTSLGTHYFGY